METTLGEWIRDRIVRNGPVPFAQFMEWALYHPEHGYYAAGHVRVGSDRGDFTTAAHMSPLFARCLARLVGAADAALGRPDPFVLVEGGPGEGRLARELLGAVRRRAPELYRRLAYVPDEVSPALARRQAEALREHGERFRQEPPEIPFRGVYLSNELVDAFPVHRIRWTGGRALEVYVDAGSEGLVEVLGPPSRPDLADLAAEGVDPDAGGEREVNLQARRWMGEVAGRIARGYAVTVDYGDEAARLYRRRPRGTCLAYRGHRASEDLLANPGEQDLTAHVDFTALREEGERHGLAPHPLLPQRDFLLALGLTEEIRELEAACGDEVERAQVRQDLAPLLLPGMGEAFKALVQAKNAPLDALPLDPALGVGAPAPLP